MLTLDDLRRLAEKHSESLTLRVNEFDIRGKRFAFNTRPHLMGVVNLSPDSWYRESVCLTHEAAVQRGQRLSVEGADLVDVGAESSILTAAQVDSEGQKVRLLPVIRGLVDAGIIVSAETYDLEVARACLGAGAAVLNLTGTTQSEEMFRLVADAQAAVILCYVEGANVRAVENIGLEEDMIPRMEEHFSRQIDLAVKLGVKRIFIDPGLGFYYRNLQNSAVRVRHQMRTFLNTFRLRRLGWPICHALPHAFEFFEDEVRSAEPFFAIMALLGQTSLLRTHEVARVRGVCRTMGIWQS